MSVDSLSARFERIWNTGVPIVVDNVTQKLQIDWSPDYFISSFGQIECTVEDCVTQEGITSTIADFFQGFHDAAKTRLLRLKVHKLGMSLRWSC